MWLCASETSAEDSRSSQRGRGCGCRSCGCRCSCGCITCAARLGNGDNVQFHFLSDVAADEAASSTIESCFNERRMCTLSHDYTVRRKEYNRQNTKINNINCHLGKIIEIKIRILNRYKHSLIFMEKDLKNRHSVDNIELKFDQINCFFI